MFTQTSRCRSIRQSSVLLFALLFATTSLCQAEDAGAPPATVPGINSPPIDQALVPEGVFATQLAEALKLGSISDGAKAEELLSGIGIEPKNGWIAEYPVTPSVLGDIEDGVSKASDEGKITLKRKDALKLVGDVKSELGLDVDPGPKTPVALAEKPVKKIIYTYTDSKGEIHITDDLDAIPKKYRDHVKTRSPLNPNGSGGNAGDNGAGTPSLQPMASPNPEDIDDFYYGQGPPVVTYYTPPPPYAYLYSWTPYPFWSTGFYFPGFFILNNFHRHVVFNRHPSFVSHHHGGFPPYASRPLPGKILPGVATHWFRSHSALAGAGAIVDLNKNHHRLAGTSLASQMGIPNGPLGSHHGLGLNHPINTPAMVGFNSQSTIGHNQGFRPHNAFGRENFGRFQHGGASMGFQGGGFIGHRAYQPNVSGMHPQPNFANGQMPQSPYPNSGVVVQGGFHHAGGFGGFQGGGNFIGHQGSFFGGGAGGHRHR